MLNFISFLWKHGSLPSNTVFGYEKSQSSYASTLIHSLFSIWTLILSNSEMAVNWGTWYSFKWIICNEKYSSWLKTWLFCVCLFSHNANASSPSSRLFINQFYVYLSGSPAQEWTWHLADQISAALVLLRWCDLQKTDDNIWLQEAQLQVEQCQNKEQGWPWKSQENKQTPAL